MTNREIYKKTLTFSLRGALFDLAAFAVIIVCGVIGFIVAEKTTDIGALGLVLGLIVGLVFFALILRYVSYTYKAGQIAMMTKAVTEGSLPDDVLAEGKRVVRERFLTVALYFGATKIIKMIFNELGRVLMRVGKTVGGKEGNGIAAIINMVVSTIVAYLCDCCLGWVFFRKDENAAKATCEGAVIFFKHWKVFAENMGRVFGIGCISLVGIGGVFTALFYSIASRFPDVFAILANELASSGKLDDSYSFLGNPTGLMIVTALVCALIVWGIIHSIFVKPFVLAGVLRNFLNSGKEDIPDETSFAMLDEKSKRFRKLHEGL